MAAAAKSRTLQLVFGKAFLLALEDGNTDSAMVFARALLTQMSRENAPSAFAFA